MLVTINNRLFKCSNGDNITKVLETAGLNVSINIAVAIGSQIIPRSKWECTTVYDGDKILVIKAAYGG
ncbi:MAG: sulfur carrier protein ThiS [Paludibacteraceae bacterium]|nr:sulfur carrier protein ThiS [Paludibacteraceae bacterium]